MSIHKGLKKAILLAALFTGIVTLHQNCSPGFEVKDFGSIAPNAFTNISTNSLNKKCFSSNTTGACIFLKNPVSQTQKTISSSSVAALELEQTFPVAISKLTTATTLMNNSFIVYRAGSGESLHRKPDGGWGYKLTEPDGVSKVGQLMSFYWANYAAETAQKNTGIFYASGKQIKIVTDDTVFGWAPSKNQIHLLTTPQGRSMALDASVITYFLGWANLDYATQGKIEISSKNLNTVCGSDGAKDCCASVSGCSRALASGQADYLAAITFPDHTAVGDGWSNSLNGQTLCGTSGGRSPEAAKMLTAQSSFNLCVNQQQPGSIYAMGSMYSSIWWEVRKTSGTNTNEVDRLYMLHLAQLNGDDDFVTVQQKILALDQQNFGGKYSAAFKAEFKHRGL